MTRKETLALYRPIRAEIRKHLSAAPELADDDDWQNYADALGLLTDGTTIADEQAFDMLIDAVVFTPDASNSRLIDRYAAALTDRREQAFARRLAKGVFSVWDIQDRHPQGGVIAANALGRGKPRHLMDQGLEKSAPKGALVAMRVFDAGPFSCAFGIVVPLSRNDTTLLQMLGREIDAALLPLFIYIHAIHDVSVAETLLSDFREGLQQFGERTEAA